MICISVRAAARNGFTLAPSTEYGGDIALAAARAITLK